MLEMTNMLEILFWSWIGTSVIVVPIVCWLVFGINPRDN